MACAGCLKIRAAIKHGLIRAVIKPVAPILKKPAPMATRRVEPPEKK